MQLLDRGQVGDAGLAPGGPVVQEHQLAAIGRDVQRLFGRGLAGEPNHLPHAVQPRDGAGGLLGGAGVGKLSLILPYHFLASSSSPANSWAMPNCIIASAESGLSG